jgi:hypothetical protein
MIWQNPWAWIGLIALGVPIVIHLLSRQSARVQPFPTLRFLDGSRLQPVRRTQLRDALLMAVRMAILAVAVAALAQPLLRTRDRERSAGGMVTRAIVLDTSASMSRPSPTGERASEIARQDADEFAAQANASVLLESRNPAHAIAGAVAWLRTQPGAREIIVISDFQSGTVDSTTFAQIPPDIGIRLSRIETTNPATLEMSFPGGADSIAGSITLEGFRTGIEWRNTGARAVSTDGLAQYTSAEESAAAAAALHAAIMSGAPPHRARDVAIVYGTSPEREQLLRNATALDAPGMASFLLDVSRAAVLEHSAAVSNLSNDPVAMTLSAPFTPVGPRGAPIALAARGSIEGEDRLLFFPLSAAGTLESAALLSAVLNASAEHPPVAELEPAHVSADLLRAWERPAGTELMASNTAQASDAPWFWVVVLLLLVVEWQIRNRTKSAHAVGPND